MATTKVTSNDLSRVVQNRAARNRIKTLLDALTDAMDLGALTALSVTTAMLQALSVTTAKIATNAVTGAKLDGTLCGAPTALSGAGAIAITSPYCLFTSTGSAQALTLADGGFTGQSITVRHAVDGGSGVITQTTGAKLRADITTITFTNVGDWVTLVWTGTLWTPVQANGVTIATS